MTDDQITADMTDEQIKASLLAFMRESFQAGQDINEETALVGSGILDSLKTAMLINYIRDSLHTPIPASCIDAGNFTDVATITSMIRELTTATGSSTMQ